MSTQPKPNEGPSSNEGDRWERRHHHRGSGIVGALILIALGVLLFLANQNIISWDKWWQYFIVAIGAILLVDGAVTYSRSDERRGWPGRIIAGIVLIGVGIAFLIGESFVWPLVIIAAGVAILLSNFLKKR